jgi:hypothetical protein
MKLGVQGFSISVHLNVIWCLVPLRFVQEDFGSNVGYLRHSRQAPEYNLKIGHDHVIQHLSKSIIHIHPVIQHKVTAAVGEAFLNNPRISHSIDLSSSVY